MSDILTQVTTSLGRYIENQSTVVDAQSRALQIPSVRRRRPRKCAAAKWSSPKPDSVEGPTLYCVLVLCMYTVYCVLCMYTVYCVMCTVYCVLCECDKSNFNMQLVLIYS